MIHKLNPKCDFSELPAFFEICKSVLEPYAKEGKWDDVAGLVYYSGWLHGVGDLMKEISSMKLKEIMEDERLCRNMICIQRGVFTVIKAMGQLVCYDDAAKFFFRVAPQIFPACFDGKGDIEAIFSEFRSIIDTMNVWIACHGADGEFIRRNVKSSAQDRIYKTERKFGKSIGCSMAGLVSLTYQILLDRVFWPSYHKIEDAQRESGIVYCDAGFSRSAI